jgi:hypothetical protein
VALPEAQAIQLHTASCLILDVNGNPMANHATKDANRQSVTVTVT